MVCVCMHASACGTCVCVCMHASACGTCVCVCMHASACGTCVCVLPAKTFLSTLSVQIMSCTWEVTTLSLNTNPYVNCLLVGIVTRSTHTLY